MKWKGKKTSLNMVIVITTNLNFYLFWGVIHSRFLIVQSRKMSLPSPDTHTCMWWDTCMPTQVRFMCMSNLALIIQVFLFFTASIFFWWHYIWLKFLFYICQFFYTIYFILQRSIQPLWMPAGTCNCECSLFLCLKNLCFWSFWSNL